MPGITTDFSRRLRLQGPLIVAPLGGGPTTPGLVAATCNAGALGSLAAAYLSVEQIDASVAEVRRLTQRPFAMNLFTPMPEVRPSVDQVARAIEATRVFREELRLPEPRLEPPFHPDFANQFEAVLRAAPAVFSFVFGLLDREYLKECRRKRILSMGTATSLEEAQTLEDSGVDAVAVQGIEAGGHRGLFHAESEDPGVGIFELVQQASSKLRIPVIAAGGIMDGEGIARALRSGAQAAMLGTAFLLCPEAGTSAPYRAALAERSQAKTRLTRVFSGRWARGIENRFLREMEESSASILPFPAQNAFTRDIRSRATRDNQPEYLSLWAGTGFEKIRAMPAGYLVRVLWQELESAWAVD